MYAVCSTERWREGRAFQSGGKAPLAGKGKHPAINCWALGPSRLRAGLWSALPFVSLAQSPLALSSHPSLRHTSKGEDATWAQPTVQGVNPNVVAGREHGEVTPAPVIINLSVCVKYKTGEGHTEKIFTSIMFPIWPFQSNKGKTPHTATCTASLKEREMSGTVCWAFDLFSCQNTDEILLQVSVLAVLYSN